jgi:hypothetical protein
VDQPRTYLVSIVGIPLAPDESVQAFAFATGGVTFDAVCHIPGGWRIRAGASLTPNGVLEGDGSQGVTWFRSGSPPALRSLVLVTLYGPVQRRDIRSRDGSSLIPATFGGYATITTDDGERTMPLSHRNIRLMPARRCPPVARLPTVR